MAKSQIKVSAKVADTMRPRVTAKHPALNALRSIADRKSVV